MPRARKRHIFPKIAPEPCQALTFGLSDIFRDSLAATVLIIQPEDERLTQHQSNLLYLTIKSQRVNCCADNIPRC